MPLSRLDLPRIVEAVEELYRTIEHPPAETWHAPTWLVEQYKQTTLGEAGVPKNPSHAHLIDAAATEVLNRIMPPWHHRKGDCPEITQSQLDNRHKVLLIELRTLLLTFALGNTLAANRSKAFQVLDFLETVLEQLSTVGLTREQGKQTGGPLDQGQAGHNDGAGGMAAPTAMSDDIEAIFRRAAEEEAQREEVRRRECDESARQRPVWDLFRQLETFGGSDAPPGEEDFARYADLLVRLCRAARDAGLADGPPDMASGDDGSRLAVEVLRLAFAEDGAGICNLLRKAGTTLGTRLVRALLALLSSKVLGRRASPTGEGAAAGARCGRDQGGAGAAEEAAVVASGPTLPDPTMLPWIPIASDVPDLGKAGTVHEFWQWCNRQREGLRQFRVRLGEPEPASVATDEFRVIPEVVHQCRNYLVGSGADEIPERFAFPTGSSLAKEAVLRFVMAGSCGP